MRLGTQQCFVVSSSERAEAVILLVQSVNAGCLPSSCCTVGVFEMVFRIHTHHLWNAKTSGVVRNVSIIVNGTEGDRIGSNNTWEGWLLLVRLVAGREAGRQGCFSSLLCTHWRDMIN